MIHEIKIAHCEWKRNWIDQNKVVFGYDDTQDCCESWGWGVYDSETKEKVSESPDGLPYHFDFESGTEEVEFSCHLTDEVRERMLYGKNFEYVDVLSVVRVKLLPDEGTDGKPLVFEAFTDHNGYYLHSFSFDKEDKSNG